MSMPWKVVMGGMAHVGTVLVVGVTIHLLNTLVVMGDARCSCRHAIGFFPLVWACMMKPANASYKETYINKTLI